MLSSPRIEILGSEAAGTPAVDFDFSVARAHVAMTKMARRETNDLENMVPEKFEERD